MQNNINMINNNYILEKNVLVFFKLKKTFYMFES